METKKPNQPRAANGKFAKKQTRPINTLKPTEAIQVNNDAERDGIIAIMDETKWRWHRGDKPKDYKTIEYPTCIHIYRKEGDKSIIVHDRIDYIESIGLTILPASDFLPTEPKAEQTTESKPTNHPLHPEFKGAKLEAEEEQNPTQPIDYKSLFHQAQSKVDELQAKVEDLNDSYEFDRAQAKKHREILRSKMIDYAKTWPSSHSAQLLGELILDGLI